MIFLTVGTLFPFDRLVKAIDNAVAEGIIKQPVFGQIGKTCLKPKYMEYAETLTKSSFDEKVFAAEYLISHAGMGTITMALDNEKPLLVMPRSKKYGEVVNDHQVAIARKFEEFGHILVAYTQDELSEKIEKLKSFVPQPRKNQAKEVATRIAKFLHKIDSERT